MAIQLTAPYPLKHTTSIMPSPEWNDSYNLKDELETKHAMDGTLYTYVKHQGHRRRLLFEVRMTYLKALEIEAFFRAYYASVIYIKDWLNQEWVGYAVNNPFEFTTDEASSPNPSGRLNCNLPTIGNEFTSIQFEFEVVPKGYESEL